jgi:hypothetical protein
MTKTVQLTDGRHVPVNEIIDQQVCMGVGRSGPYPGVNNWRDYLPNGNTPSPDDGWTNNIDWNNSITGNPRNAIELNLNEVRAGLAVTNAVDIPAGESNEKSS